MRRFQRCLNAPPPPRALQEQPCRHKRINAPHGVSSKKVEVVQLPPSRAHCALFWPTIPPLQVEPSFACSVSSLSQSPGLQLPGCQHLRVKNLADYLLGQDRPSTQSTRGAWVPCTAATKRSYRLGPVLKNAKIPKMLERAPPPQSSSRATM